MLRSHLRVACQDMPLPKWLGMEIKTLDSFRLLLLEVSHEAEIFKNEGYRKQHCIGVPSKYLP